jgi:hypothetical protein
LRGEKTTFDDILLLKRDVTTPTFCHTRDELQQPVEAVQVSFTSSPIKTHDFVVPKVAVTAENIQFLFYSTFCILFFNGCKFFKI